MRETHRKSPFVTMCFVDKGYSGDEAQRTAFEASRISITVVQRNDKQIKGFIVLPKRWVVERTLGWINRARRLAKDFEATIESALARDAGDDPHDGQDFSSSLLKAGVLDFDHQKLHSQPDARDIRTFARRLARSNRGPGAKCIYWKSHWLKSPHS